MGGTLQAQLFLHELIKLLDEGRVRLQPRNPKTWEFMAEHDLREEDVLALCREIKEDQYQWGPEKDINGTSGNVMLFFLPWQGMLLYMKIKTWVNDKGKRGAVISFHEEGMHDA